ncbi:hypothetical protein ABZP36_024225 [Zizania latifolia]
MFFSFAFLTILLLGPSLLIRTTSFLIISIYHQLLDISINIDFEFFSIGAMEQPEDHPKPSGKEREYHAQPKDDMFPIMKQPCTNVRHTKPMDDVAQHLIGNLLPDDEDELLAGVINDFDHVKLRTQVEESEEYDVFRNSGGMELGVDPLESITFSIANASLINGTGSNTSQYSIQNGAGIVTGEHPYGEHPSRTLFVRNIDSNVEDSELRSLFEPFGDIWSMYTTTKHRGFIMISYYDIRHARSAKNTLQNKPLRRRKVDVHYSIPKGNPSDKDMNQGTLVIFNLEPAVSNEELLRIFGAFGEVREVKTPHKRHHRFIEFYDVRAAECALRSLNKSDIAGKRVKLEPSRPGGARRSFIQQFNHEFEQDETRHNSFRLGSPSANSPPSLWSQLDSPTEENKFNVLNETAFRGGMSPLGSNYLSGLSSGYPPMKSSIGKSSYWNNHADNMFHGSPTFHNSHSFPEHHGGIVSPTEENKFNVLNETAFSGGMSPLGSNYLSGLSSGYPPMKSSIGKSSYWNNHADNMFHGSPTFHNSHSFPEHHGGIVSPTEENKFNVLNETAFSGGMSPLGSNYLSGLSSGYPPMKSSIGKSSYWNSHADNMFHGSPTFHNSHSFPEHHGGIVSASPLLSSAASSASTASGFTTLSGTSFLWGNKNTLSDHGLLERGRNQTVGNSGGQEDNRVQYQLDLEKIIPGKDTRTTLMIKNIPNKYTSNMLLEVINETHEGTYDFFYLPIDFKNKCNVGYAFINMASPVYIVSFYKAFAGRKWEKFNSEKVVSLAYARIQGQAALVNHFQNSSLMSVDKYCRPMLFDPKHTESGNQILLNGTNISVTQQNGTQEGRDLPENQEDNFSENSSNWSTGYASPWILK